MTTTTTSSVPLPPGADESGDWIDEDHVYAAPYRIVYCHRHDIAGLNLSVEGSAAARELAAAPVAIADEVDGWTR
jgi:5'(3')-deoxyribonucleotidase